MERFAGIAKQKISSIVVFPPDSYGNNGAVIWDKLIKAVRGYMRREWPQMREESFRQDVSTFHSGQAAEVNVTIDYRGWALDGEYEFAIEIVYFLDDLQFGHTIGMLFGTTPIEEEPNPLERFEQGEDIPPEPGNPAIDGDLVKHLEKKFGISLLEQDRQEFDPGYQYENEIYFGLGSYVLVVPPNVYDQLKGKELGGKVVEGS